MIIQLINVTIKPERRDTWLELVRANIAQSRTEPGCESYQLCEDIETPDRFVIVERWSSMQALHAHFRAPEFGQLMAALGDVIAGRPEVSIHQVASTQTLDEVLATAAAN